MPFVVDCEKVPLGLNLYGLTELFSSQQDLKSRSIAPDWKGSNPLAGDINTKIFSQFSKK